MASKDRQYWVVSQNVRQNPHTVAAWSQACVRGRAAFMGYDPDDMGHNQTGYKFAHAIKPRDVVLIARSHNRKPEIVGFGIVRGRHKLRISGLRTPQEFGSLRTLSPFIPQNGPPPTDIPFIDVLHIKALTQLHPDREDKRSHQTVCNWMDQKLRKELRSRENPTRAIATPDRPRKTVDVRIVTARGNYQLDYKIQTRMQKIRAKKSEAKLLDQYRFWLKRQNRKLLAAKYKQLECDGYEEARRNLVEAKSSCRREYIRMAVGQLLDYSFQGRQNFGIPNMAVLLPSKPDPKCVAWLGPLKISIVWREKSVFLDNANRQFA
jgi:hypothetical protein